MYKIVGRKIYVKKEAKGSRWTLKQICESPDNARKALRAIGMGATRKHATSRG